MPPKKDGTVGEKLQGRIDKKKRGKGKSNIEAPGGGRDIQREALERECAGMSKRELQGKAAQYILYETLKSLDPFIPRPEFLWLISAGIKSGKTQMVIGAMEKLQPLYEEIFYLSPQEEHEAKVRSHLLPMISNEDTEYTPGNMNDVLNRMDEIHKKAVATKCGALRTLEQKANAGDDEAYRALVVRQLWGGQEGVLPTGRHMRQTREERYKRDKMLATGGRCLLLLDDATMVAELRSRSGDARTSFLGRLVRMRHKGVDIIIIVHNRGNVSTVIKGSATVDTLFDPRSPADKKGVVENTSGLSMKGLESLVQLAQGTSPHATVTLYKGAPQDRKIAINLNTWINLEWDSTEPEPIPAEEAMNTKPSWAPAKVLAALPSGRALLARIRRFEAGGDPDEEQGKDSGLADNRNPNDTRQSALDRRNARRRNRRALNKFNHITK